MPFGIRRFLFWIPFEIRIKHVRIACSPQFVVRHCRGENAAIGLFVVSGIWSEEDVDDDQDGAGIDEECQDGDKDYRLAAQVGLDENQHEKVHFSKRSFCPNLYIITHIWTKNIRLIKNAFPYAPHSQSYHHVLHDGNISVLNE